MAMTIFNFICEFITAESAIYRSCRIFRWLLSPFPSSESSKAEEQRPRCPRTAVQGPQEETAESTLETAIVRFPIQPWQSRPIRTVAERSPPKSSNENRWQPSIRILKGAR